MLKIKILSHAGYESSLIFNKFQSFEDSIPNEFRGPFLQRESKHMASSTRAGGPVGNSEDSQTHAIEELPALKLF